MLLEDSAARFDQLGMTLQAACSRHRLGLLLGGKEGRTWHAEADATIRQLGVRRPERWIAMQAEGFAELAAT